MNKLTNDRNAVLEVLRQTIFHLGGDSGDKALIKRIGKEQMGITSDTQWTIKRDTTLDMLQRAYEREHDRKLLIDSTRHFSISPSESASKDLYIPRDRTIAVFQAAMDEFIDQKLNSSSAKTNIIKRGRKNRAKSSATESSAFIGSVEMEPSIDLFFTNTGSATMNDETTALASFDKFGNLDPGWIAVVWEKAKALLRGKAKFIKHQNKTDFRFNIIDKAEVKIALVSDWGGGNDAARAIAAAIKQRNPDYVIHLGDVYYAGTEHEIKNRFLNLRDFGDSASLDNHSFALNSNHEMYGGGHGYFKKTLKAFKQPASYFSLSNKHWQFIGLDTGYVDHDLNAEQIDWLGGQLGGSAKTILLSHHQPFSAFADEDSSKKLLARVEPFLNKVHGWFWGHEHLCVSYGNHKGIKGRCIGHGCIPYDVPNPPLSDKVPVDWMDDREQPGGGGMHGFALLTLNSDHLRVEYIDHNGHVFRDESF